MLSKELQIGKAAEHLVVADLLLQGHNAFLSDQGLPFDVVVVGNRGQLCRVQVKATQAPMIRAKSNNTPHYRFGLRHAKGNIRAMSAADVDVMALVALQIRKIAYLPIDAIRSRKNEGRMVQCIDMYDTHEPGRTYSSGKVRRYWGRKFDDFATFPTAG